MKVACLGAGYFSQFHLDGWRRIDGVTLAGVADKDLAKAQATHAAAFSDLADMLSQTKPDILDIIVPPEGHADAIRTGLKHDLRAIVCQKPFCTSLDEAKDMVALADEKGVPLIVHENFRFQPWFRAIKTSIDNGDIGTVLQATFRLRPGDGQGPDAYLERQPYFQKIPRFLIHETGVHYIDTFTFLFGKPEAVYADLRKINPAIAGEDAGFVLFDHPHGIKAMFDGNRCLDHAAENTRCTMGEGLFEGTSGTLRLKGDGSVWLRQFETQSEVELLSPDKSGRFGGDCTYNLQKHIIEHFRVEIPLENQAVTYIGTMEVEAAIYEAAQKSVKVKCENEWSQLSKSPNPIHQ